MALLNYKKPAVLVMIHQLLDDGGVQVTEINSDLQIVEERGEIPVEG